jgi:hypothetical protein
MTTEAFMKIRASVIVFLLSLAAFIAPKPVEAAGLTLNPAQGFVGSEVTIVSILAYGNGEYFVYWGEDKKLINQGTTSGISSVTFTVPESPRGKYKITLKVGGNAYDGEFNVLPAIKLSATEGYIGSSLTVTGTGFNANETGIEVIFGGNAIATGISADSRGNWQSTFEIPPNRSGNMVVDAGGTTPATEVDNKSFTVLSKIDINPTAGGVGTMVAVSGTGFGNSESGISITYDGLKVKTAIAADSNGSWQSTFFIPTSTKGGHRINSYGDVTGEGSVAGVSFAVSPALKLELASGQLGDVILVGDDFWASGIGFEQNEGGILVTFDGAMITSGIVADANGSWAVKLKVPLSSHGEHVVDAAGKTTGSDDVADAALVVSPHIEVNPASGGVGADIVVNGTGFGANQPLTISYDGTQVASGSTTDAKGSFASSFKVPKGKPGGDHAITVIDATASVASASFKTETLSPPMPRPVSPEAGSKLGLVGNTTVTFSWTAVEDPSGVDYTLEISNNPEFTGAVLRKEGLAQAQYTLTKDEALPDGSYYWRIKAVDGAGNESNWTNGQLFKVGGEWWLFAVAFGVIVILALVIWRVVSIRRRAWK